jgi:hypothetical protein
LLPRKNTHHEQDKHWIRKKGLEKFSKQMELKATGVGPVISDKAHFKPKLARRDK